jgi:hypothetical protein
MDEFIRKSIKEYENATLIEGETQQVAGTNYKSFNISETINEKNNINISNDVKQIFFFMFLFILYPK